MIGRNIPKFGLTKESDWNNTGTSIALFFYRLSVSIDTAIHYRYTGELITDEGANHIVCDELGLTLEHFAELFDKGASIVEQDETLAGFYEQFTRSCGKVLADLGFTDDEITSIADRVDVVDAELTLLNELWEQPSVEE